LYLLSKLLVSNQNRHECGVSVVAKY
ncbi:uncharacterized protein METZ01_LOCUS435209, partial [marine metagenome]